MGQSAGFMRNLAPLSGLAALIALEGFNLHSQPQSNGQRSNLFKRQVIYIAVILLLTVVFLSKKLVIHHIVTAEPQFISLLLMMPVVLTYFIANYFIPSLSRNKSLSAYAALIVTGLSVGYTLITEPPIVLTTERNAMGQVAQWYTDCLL